MYDYNAPRTYRRALDCPQCGAVMGQERCTACGFPTARARELLERKNAAGNSVQQKTVFKAAESAKNGGFYERIDTPVEATTALPEPVEAQPEVQPEAQPEEQGGKAKKRNAGDR